MKVPYLSRCFITIPPISFSDAESVSGESATTMVIGCEVGSSSNEKMQNRNVFVLLRKKFSRSDRDHVIAARQALGLDSTKRSDPEDDAENSPAKRSRDIDCKGLRCQTSSTNSLPPTNNKSDRIDKNMTDTVSLPPTSSTRRRLLSVDSSHSMMDESCSGQSILDELLMEVYKDPYEDFLHKLKSSKKMQDRIDEIEVDVLTQLPAIKTQLSPKRMRSRRRLTYHHTTSSPAIISTQSQSTSQRSFTRLENRDDESVKSPVEYKIPKSGTFVKAISITYSCPYRR
jgi:hypothetical protein